MLSGCLRRRSESGCRLGQQCDRYADADGHSTSAQAQPRYDAAPSHFEGRRCLGANRNPAKSRCASFALRSQALSGCPTWHVLERLGPAVAATAVVRTRAMCISLTTTYSDAQYRTSNVFCYTCASCCCLVPLRTHNVPMYSQLLASSRRPCVRSAASRSRKGTSCKFRRLCRKSVARPSSMCLHCRMRRTSSDPHARRRGSCTVLDASRRHDTWLSRSDA